jgi:putative solute:sodium symporter small subunit
LRRGRRFRDGAHADAAGADHNRRRAAPARGAATGMDSAADAESKAARHWRRVLRLTLGLALVWAAIVLLLPGTVHSLHGRGLVLGGFPLAYWLTAQGALLAFVAIVVAYALWMERLDARFRDEPPPPGDAPSGDGPPGPAHGR